jgi:hypothetical protein
MAFLEVVTRCYKRPNTLKRNIASLKRQTDKDYSQMFLVDEIGIGIAKANRQLHTIAKDLTGDYILILDDDDIIEYPYMIEDLKIGCNIYNPSLIIVKFYCTNYGILPTDEMWYKKPELAKISMSSFITRKDIYQKYSDYFHEATAADWNFVTNVYDYEKEHTFWWNKVIGRTLQKGYGQSE